MASDDLKAITNLRAKHTAKKPTVPFKKACDDARALAPSAVVPFLVWVYTPVGQGTVPLTMSFSSETFRLAEVVLDVSAQAQFASEVLLNVASAPSYRQLAPLVRAWISPRDLFFHLTTALRGNNWLHIYNALELPIDVFREDYALTPKQDGALRAFAEAFAELPTAPPLVRTAAAEFRLPGESRVPALK